MKLKHTVLGGLGFCTGILGGIFTTFQKNTELLAFTTEPENIWNYGPLLSAVMAGLGGFATIRGLLAKSATPEDVEKVRQSAERARRAGVEAERAVRGEGAKTRLHDTEEHEKTRQVLRAFMEGIDNQGLSEDRVFELARSVREDIDDIDDARRELSYLVGVARDYLLSGGRGDNLDEFVTGVLNAAKSKPRFADGADEIDNGLKQVKRDKQDAADRLAQLDQSEVTLLEEGIKLDVLALRPNAVADKEIRLIELTEPAERQFTSIRAKRREYYERGRDKGIRIDLEIAIALARLCLARATDPDEAGMAGNDLGIALQTLGEREAGTKRLEEAVTAYRAALEERTRVRVPLDWAMTQMNLGNALLTLGQRESETKRLEEAVTAYRAALEERTRDRVPLDWAMTQCNLGIVLRTLGERESGTKRLKQAVTAFQNALKENTRDRAPLDWATTQMNLGNALLNLGQRESRTKRLEQAVTAYQNALEERTRDRVPLDWAMTQMNLGIALLTLGQRESGTERLEQAVTAYRAALEERTRDRVPLDWATTKNNLAVLYEALGDKGEDQRSNYLRSIACTDAALEIFETAGASQYVAIATRNRDRVQAKLEALGDGD